MTTRSNITTSQRRRTSSLLAALALAAGAGCAATDRVALRQPEAPARVRVAPVVQPKRQLTVDRAVEHAVVDEASPNSGAIEQMALNVEADHETVSSRSVEASGFIASGQSPDGPYQPISYSAMPRMPVVQGCPPAAPCPDFANPLDEPPYPEELLCDGGDAGHPFHYEGTNIAGLEPEDTVAEFTDHEGAAHVRISSRACVYAPKFGAVRSISAPVQDYAVDVLGGAHRFTSVAGFDDERRLIVAENVDQLADTRARVRANSLDTEASERAMHQTIGAEQHVKLQNLFEDYGSQTEGQFQQTTEAYLAATLQIAGESVNDIGPVIVANDVFGQAVSAVDSAEVFAVAEDRRTPGELRVVKLADQQAAQPGDVLTFRIRFYNDGGRELTSVRILDRLSPRLEYVAGSADSELKSKLTVEDDEFGGQLLRFELATPLEGGASGEISFQAVAK